MSLLDNSEIYKKYLLCELFDTHYPIIEIKGVLAGGVERKFNSFDKLLSFHLNKMDTTSIYYIKCYFRNKNNNTIELLIRPTTMHGSLFQSDVYEIFAIIFHDVNDPYKLKLNSDDASIVTATVMNTVIDFLKSYKKLIAHTSKDWDKRTNHGILRFDPYPNSTMNPVSKQIRNQKEITNGISQRANIYSAAFAKIAKPLFPELFIIKLDNYYIVKS